jgi:hypothetical protein
VQPLPRGALAAAAALVITSLHHLYGARRFDTPWRAHVVQIALSAGGLLAVFLFVEALGRGRPAARIARWGALGVVATIAAWLGLYEGGYNHVVKVIAYAALPLDTFARLFPAPTYELPNDLWFETSGILQCPLGLYAGGQALRSLRRSR